MSVYIVITFMFVVLINKQIQKIDTTLHKIKVSLYKLSCATWLNVIQPHYVLRNQKISLPTTLWIIRLGVLCIQNLFGSLQPVKSFIILSSPPNKKKKKKAHMQLSKGRSDKIQVKSTEKQAVPIIDFKPKLFLLLLFLFFIIKYLSEKTL